MPEAEGNPPWGPSPIGVGERKGSARGFPKTFQIKDIEML